MRFTVKHPTNQDLSAVVGHDKTAIRWFIEVREKGKLIDEYDGLTAEEPSTLQGVLDRLVTNGFFGINGKDAVKEALAFLPIMSIEEMPGKDVRRAAEVIQKLKEGVAD
jgi:hypothetical protein